MSEFIDHCSTDEVVCPWCGHVYQDSWEFFRRGETEGKARCEQCNKPFFIWQEMQVTYTTAKKEKVK